MKLISKLYLLTFVLLSLSNLNAQDKGSLEVGLAPGLNISRLTSSNETADSKVSFNTAVSAEYYISDKWGIKMRFMYDRKGYANGVIVDLSSNRAFETNFKYNYVTIPVMANWHFGRNKNWYLNFGLYLGLLLEAEDTEFRLDVSDQVNSTDFGLSAGLGYKFKVGENIKLFVEYDAQTGFLNVIENDLNPNNTLNNRDAINFGVLFEL